MTISSAKTVIVGETQVGKTTLAIRAFLHNYDQTLKPRPTLGSEYFEGIIQINDEGDSVKFEVWDTAGQEAYRSISPLFFQDSAIALLVFDVTRPDTIKSLDYYADILHEREPGCFIAVVGNKIDLHSERKISRDEGEMYTRRIGSSFYIETSALTGEGVQELFFSLAQQNLTFSKHETIHVGNKTETNEKGSKCC
ncbi:Ras- protein Rab-31 [Tritrichomonas musculus]|uniref:Ras- protein Rab-31 n=1 Tax=Tritrichomonas musculus TaxID=1915356 RepID=A0ABR2GMW9_9EUKA